VVGVAMFLATSSYLVVGYTGVAIYGQSVDPDIILSFPSDSIVMTVGRVAITLSICMTYPIVLFIGEFLIAMLVNFMDSVLFIRENREIRKL
jgi:amino acid permease